MKRILFLLVLVMLASCARDKNVPSTEERVATALNRMAVEEIKKKHPNYWKSIWVVAPLGLTVVIITLRRRWVLSY